MNNKITLTHRFWLLVVGYMIGIGFQSKAQELPDSYTGNLHLNYIRSWNAIRPDTNRSNFNISSGLQRSRMTTQYFDGLGRPVQAVVKQGSMVSDSLAVDLVSSNIYDEYGREAYSFLPFAANNTGGNQNISDGLFKINPFQQQATFMTSQFGNQGETYFYGQAVYEPSPLNRVTEQFAPGDSWVGTADETLEESRRSVKTRYWINRVNDSVRIWNVTDVTNGFGNYNSPGVYPEGELFKNVMIDEHGKQVIEFKDKEGQVVLKRVQLTAEIDTGAGSGHAGWLNTYYLYDNFNRLRCVVQPKGVELLMANAWNPEALSGAILLEQCFRYAFDHKGRMIRKKVPGAGEVWMVYDARDRLVLTQDALLRSRDKWMYLRYDGLNRPIATGLWENEEELPFHSSLADTSFSYPDLTGQDFEELTNTFYDSYDWRNAYGDPLSDSRSNEYDTYLQTPSNLTYPYPQDATVRSKALRGMVTGTRTKVLGTSTYLFNVNFYDDNGRVVQTQSTNISGGTDVGLTQYSWAGFPVLSIVRQEKSGVNAQETVSITRMTYDELGRIEKVEKKIGNSKVDNGNLPTTWAVLSEHAYDELGQLKQKEIGQKRDENGDYTSVPIETLTYDYNIRGWMLGMNRSYLSDTASTANYFGFDLGYDKTGFLVNGNNFAYAGAQYNGNIGGMQWKSTGDDRLRKYDFSYDAVNRLTGADFNQFTQNSFNKNANIDFSVTGLDYDANGNILQMNQAGWKLGGSATIDSLLYSYYDHSNRLKSVIDRTNDPETKLGDFRSSASYMTILGGNKTIAATDYLYDVNGSMNQDKNKDIENIHYNHLNLPDSITVTGKGTIKYTYDASGSKLKKVVTEGSKVTTTLYMMANYVNDTLQFIGAEEGRARLKDSTLIVYDYFLKDHLGNIRMVLTDERRTDAYPVASLEDGILPNERLFYSGVDSGRMKIESVEDYPSDDYTDPNEYTQRLNGNESRIGAGIVLKVMAGDKFNLRVSSWWKSTNSPGTPVSPLNSLLSALNNGIGSMAGSHGTVTELETLGSLTGPVSDFLTTHDSYNTSKPKAFVNWILFDEQFNFVSESSGFEQVGNSDDFIIHLKTDLTLEKNGYLYVYVSNETPNIDVFFDNLQVTHVRGPILEETHYYPFGLTMAGISSKALSFGNPQNRYKFNEGTELAQKEFANGSGLEFYETPFRGYDPQIGRFWQIDAIAQDYANWSPYTFALNNPVFFNDPSGLGSDPPRETSTPDNPKVLEEVVVTSSYNNSGASNGLQSWLTMMGWGALGADYYLNLNYKGDWIYRNSKGRLQSIFDTKWGSNKSPENLGNIDRYSKNARSAIRTTKFAKYLKVGGKVVIGFGLLSDAKDVLEAYLNDDPNATAIYGKAAINTTMIGVGFIPGVGWVISGLYFAIDATIGWPAAIQSFVEIEKNKSEMRKLNIMTFSDFKY